MHTPKAKTPNKPNHISLRLNTAKVIKNEELEIEI